jgi:hypothetical protein
MTAPEQADPILALTRDARLSPFALSAIPAWLWAADATRVVWANASGAAALKAATPAALTERIFEADEPVASDVARLGEALPQSGAPRLERVRGIGSSLVCTCSRLALADGTPAILVVASEVMRPALPLKERAARLFGASNEPLAVFTGEGALIYATGDLDPNTTLTTLRADALKAEALASGRVSGDSALGALTLEKIGGGSTTALLATLADTHGSAEARPEDAPEQVDEGQAPAARPPSSSAPEPEAERPHLSLVPAAENVVPFRSAALDRRPSLTPVERSAFNEIAAALAKGEAAPKPFEPVVQEAAQEFAPAPEPAAAEPCRARSRPAQRKSPRSRRKRARSSPSSNASPSAS